MEDIKMTPEQYFKSIIDRINEIKVVEDGYYKNNKIFLIDKRIYLIHELDRNCVALKREFWNTFQYENGFNLHYIETVVLLKKLTEKYLETEIESIDWYSQSGISNMEEELGYKKYGKYLL